MNIRKSLLGRMLGVYMENHRWDAVWMTIFYIMKHSPVWLMPYLAAMMMKLIEQDLPDDVRMRWLLIYSAIILVLLIQNVPTTVWYVKRASVIGRGTGRKLRLQVCKQLQQLSLLYHERVGTGRLQAKVIRDIEALEVLPRMFSNTVLNAVTVLAGTLVMVAISAPQAIWLLIVMVPLAASVRYLFRKRMREKMHEYRTSVEEMSGGLTEMVKMVPVTRAHGLEREAMADARQRIKEVADRGQNWDILTAWFNSAGWTTFAFFQSLFLSISVYMGYKGHLGPDPVSTVTGMNMYFAAANGALLTLLNMMPQMTSAVEGFESVEEVLDAPDVEFNARKTRLETIEGHIDVHDVTYTYPGGDEPAVEGLSFAVEPNQTVAIVGPSGGGKSTTLSLLLGFIRPDSGQVRYEHQDGDELDLRSYRRQVSVVGQQSFMFSGTVRENICYGRPGVTEPEIESALRNAQAWQFVNALPDGLETRLGENGQALSGGQMQRLALARAFLRDPRVLILDEPTSALDVESEIAVTEAIEAIRQDRTTIIVSHALTLAKIADRILIVEDGKIVDAGDHDELMSRDNFYSRANNSSIKLAS